MKQYVHNVKLSGRETSISLEPEFWEQFRLITMERGTTIGKLVAEIDRSACFHTRDLGVLGYWQ